MNRVLIVLAWGVLVARTARGCRAGHYGGPGMDVLRPEQSQAAALGAVLLPVGVVLLGLTLGRRDTRKGVCLGWLGASWPIAAATA